MVAVAGGEHHSMFVRQDGSLFSAGSNASGQLAIRFARSDCCTEKIFHINL